VVVAGPGRLPGRQPDHRRRLGQLVVANLAKRAGYPIRFFGFLKYGSVVVVESLLISTLYLWLRYLL